MGTTSKKASGSAAAQKANAKAKTPRPSSRNKTDSDVSGQYATLPQSLLDIWNILAASSSPLTVKQVCDQLEAKGKRTSPQTGERRMEDAIDLINTVFPHTVLHNVDHPAILHTYMHNGDLHVVVEDSFGKPLWTGDMVAVFHDSAVNPIPRTTLNYKLRETATDFDDAKFLATKAQGYGEQTPPPHAQENVMFDEDYPPLSLAAIVEVKDEYDRKVVLSCQDYDRHQNELKKKHPEMRKKKSPTRQFYLESILSPEEWQLLSDIILVYPYISKQQTTKLISAMKRMAPHAREWKDLVLAAKTPNAVRFDFIRQLENAIKNRHLVNITYGRYQLKYNFDLGGYRPVLGADAHGRYVTEPYALTWSNGYYYLVGRIEEKDEYGQIRHKMRNFRVDRILDIKSSEVTFEIPGDFDVYEYRDRTPVMYPGQAVDIKLRCHTRILSTLMDFFGLTDVKYSEPKDNYTTVTLKASENGTKLFAMQYAERVEILEPLSLREEVAKALQTAADKYK